MGTTPIVMPLRYADSKTFDVKVLGLVLGVIVSGLLFLAVPLTQMFTKYADTPNYIEAIDVPPPPPPPPLEEPPPPPPPRKKETIPELDIKPPPITLEMIEIALNPGTGGSLSGDFGIPDLGTVQQENLGSLDIFNINDLEIKPRPTRQIQPIYPPEAKRKGQSGLIVVEFIIDKTGRVTRAKVIRSTDTIFEAPALSAIREWRFTPGEKDGEKVNTRTRVPIPFNILN